MLQLLVLGHLGADAEVKTINEKKYISFRIASTEKRNDQDETTWVNVLASDNPNIMPYLKKGQQVLVQGRLKVGMYQSNNNIGLDVSCFASTLQLCGGAKKEENQQTGPHYPPGVRSASPQPTQNAFDGGAKPEEYRQGSPFPPAVEDKKDDLPF